MDLPIVKSVIWDIIKMRKALSKIASKLGVAIKNIYVYDVICRK